MRDESGTERSLLEWLVNGGVGVQAGGVGVHELRGVMWRHGCHAAGVRCVRDAGHDGHDLGYLLLQVLYLLVFLQDLTWKSDTESVETLPGGSDSQTEEMSEP